MTLTTCLWADDSQHYYSICWYCFRFYILFMMDIHFQFLEITRMTHSHTSSLQLSSLSIRLCLHWRLVGRILQHTPSPIVKLRYLLKQFFMPIRRLFLLDLLLVLQSENWLVGATHRIISCSYPVIQ